MTDAGCPLEMGEALDYLRSALPLADRLAMEEKLITDVARHALTLRERTPWGSTVPRDVFLPFVLFPRVNNEDLACYHEIIWERVSPRLEGMDMAAAAMEINRWCYENATYQSTDDRTANALTVLRRGFGRCGEESVLLVSALRACGIPARQVYAPLWSHCDDNHAWVEAWIDGRWRYMGACEPELALDSGWFTAAASKAMFCRTRAWGLLPTGEREEGREGEAWILNRTAAYARTELLTLKVTENGLPRAGLEVAFQLANMAAFGTILRKRTDAEGRVDFLTGLGTLHIRVSDGERALESAVDVAAGTDYTLDFAEARAFSPGTRDYTQRPPLESRIQPADFPEAQVAAHERWLEAAGTAREARLAAPEGLEPLLTKARGNRPVVESFLRDARWKADDARALLESLRDKDLADATPEMLVDAMLGALPWRERWPREVWVKALLCPRVADEPLRPLRGWARESLPPFESSQAVWQALVDRLTLTELTPEGLVPDLRAAWERGVASEAVRDILFVVLCRANGLPARLDPVTGEKQIWSGSGFRPLVGGAPARLRLINGATAALTAGVQFSVSVLERGAFRALKLHGAILRDAIELALPGGNYRIMTAARQIDGSLEGRVIDVTLEAGRETAVTLTLPEDRTGEKLLRVPLPPLWVQDDRGGSVALPEALGGRPGIVALIAPGQEPTEHFLNELLENRGALQEEGFAVCLVVGKESEAANDKLRQALAALPDARCFTRPEAGALLEWRRRMNAGELRLPLAVAVGEGGEGLFAFVNYNVGSVGMLIHILKAR